MKIERFIIMKYDFTTVLDREGHDSLAYDAPVHGTMNIFPDYKLQEGFDVIPMWIADMSFAVPDFIIENVKKRLEFPVYGYFAYSKEYYQAIIDWQKQQHQVNDLLPENIGYENGVIGGVVNALNILCSKGDKFLIHSPTYNGFSNVISPNGYEMVLSPLIKDNDGVWRMDYEDMERKIVENNLHVALLCSPHNPTGRVWEKEELLKAIEIFERHQVYVISDEIWSDLIFKGYHHTPTQNVNDYAKNHTISFYAPSKTFNLAGMIGSYHIVYNKWLKDRLDKEESLTHYNSMNVLSMHALIGAYTKGNEWLGQLKDILEENSKYAINYINEHFEGVFVSQTQGTYLIFLQCHDWCQKHHLSNDELYLKGLEVGVMWTNGKEYKDNYGMRMNLSLPLSRLKEALDRLDKYVFNG
ncbi:MalY/PatB family protein [Thomasclavelia ramosa]|uniref:MalY/PatB family protein n=1 Tax=Thomasclavelia ramosa TaxID=1547 RepID=UPI0034A3328D